MDNSLQPPPASASPRRHWFSFRWQLSDRWTRQGTLSASGEAVEWWGGGRGRQMLADLLVQAPVCAACCSCKHPVVSGFHRLDQNASHSSKEPPDFFCKPKQRQRWNTKEHLLPSLPPALKTGLTLASRRRTRPPKLSFRVWSPSSIPGTPLQLLLFFLLLRVIKNEGSFLYQGKILDWNQSLENSYFLSACWWSQFFPQFQFHLGKKSQTKSSFPDIF